jgi:predicted DNA-binding protein YlxM (UPF0122 family)
MIRTWLREYLGIEKLEERIDDNQARLRELEPITVDLTNRQREVLEVFLKYDEKIDVTKIANELETTRNNAGSILSDLKKKIEFDVQTVENGKKLYKLPGEERDKIFSNSKV